MNNQPWHLWLKADGRTECCWQDCFLPESGFVAALNLTFDEAKVTCPAHVALAPAARQALARAKAAANV